MVGEEPYSIPDDTSTSDEMGVGSRRTAFAELKGVASGRLDDSTQKQRAKLDLYFVVPLFCFLLGITFWWSYNVVQMLWQAGRVGTNFHLSDTVLVALLTTSIANFLALITILTKSLFPSKGKESFLERAAQLIRPSQNSGD
jgi:hypothetical protein